MNGRNGDNERVTDISELGVHLEAYRSRVRPHDVGSPFTAGVRSTSGLHYKEVVRLVSDSPDHARCLGMASTDDPGRAFVTANDSRRPE